MKVIFISDAHLKTRKARGYQSLVEFLDCLRGKKNDKDKRNAAKSEAATSARTIADVDDLYILGDFFDFWFNKGTLVYPEFREIINRLSRLKERGIKIHLCEGNHDFFLADYFTGELGLEVISNWASINIDGRRILISHGDMVDGDVKYLLLRSFLRSRFFYKLQRVLPISFLWKAAQISSDLSKEPTGESANALMGKMRAFSVRKFKDGFDAVILGHCHKHVLEESVINGKKRTFAVLGDWINHYSYLCYEDGSFTLCNFQPLRGECLQQILDQDLCVM